MLTISLHSKHCVKQIKQIIRTKWPPLGKGPEGPPKPSAGARTRGP